jgi:hypothetical protein
MIIRSKYKLKIIQFHYFGKFQTQSQIPYFFLHKQTKIKFLDVTYYLNINKIMIFKEYILFRFSYHLA